VGVCCVADGVAAPTVVRVGAGVVALEEGAGVVVVGASVVTVAELGAGVVALEEGAGVVVVGASVVTVAELGMTVVVRGGVVLELLFRLPASERRDGRQRKRRAKETQCHAFDGGLGGGERERPGDGTRLTGSASPIRGCWCCKIAPSADLPAFKVWVAVNPKLCQAL
jgi:hypothetical protein